MHSLLICPADRPAVAHLADTLPLAVAPLLGKSVIEYWLEALAARGVKHVLVLASDRPQAVRNVIGDGARWGLQIDLLPQGREFGVAEARQRFRPAGATDWLEGDDVVLLDRLPGRPDLPLFASYAGWFRALQSFLTDALAHARIGLREYQPGVWIGLHTRIDPAARLVAPCWIGEHTLVSAGATIGPDAIVEDRVVVEEGARVTRSIVGPETFVGELISVQHSLAHGSLLVNWMTDSSLHVPDAFFLCSLDDRRFAAASAGPVGRLLAAGALVATAPIALAITGWSFLRGEAPLNARLGIRPQPHVRVSSLQTFTYYELAGGSNWLKRWPQFWSVVRGDLAWVGNRPLRPTQAQSLGNDFERLWLTAPVGLVSLADANGCTDGLNDETCAHASFYAVNAGPRLNWFVLTRALGRAALAWPIRWSRRKDTPVRLSQLVPKQEA